MSRDCGVNPAESSTQSREIDAQAREIDTQSREIALQAREIATSLSRECPCNLVRLRVKLVRLNGNLAAFCSNLAALPANLARLHSGLASLRRGLASMRVESASPRVKSERSRITFAETAVQSRGLALLVRARGGVEQPLRERAGERGVSLRYVAAIEAGGRHPFHHRRVRVLRSPPHHAVGAAGIHPAATQAASRVAQAEVNACQRCTRWGNRQLPSLRCRPSATSTVRRDSCR
jgi:hypothetical protein